MKNTTKRAFWYVIAEFGIIFAGINLAFYFSQALKPSLLNLIWTLLGLATAIIIKMWNQK